MDPRLKTAIKTVVVLGTLLAAACGTAWGVRAGTSAGIGAAMAATNLYVLSRIIGALATPGASKSVSGWVLALLIKMVVLFGGIWLLLSWQVVRVIPLVAGYMTLPIGIALGSLVSDQAPSNEISKK